MITIYLIQQNKKKKKKKKKPQKPRNETQVVREISSI